MMTKDKKPFTYTPGGIDLSEIKSPRMIRRMERNLNAAGADGLPKSPQTSPLPPSPLAMQSSALPVQVFPAGAPPPPPPPPANIPPPPPMQKLPTKPVATSDGVFERPDMTRIIPENPMALLRKTPKVDRKSFLDELKEVAPQNAAPAYNQPPQYSPQPQYSPHPQQFSPQPQYSQQPQPYSPPTPQPQYSQQPQPYSPPTPQPQQYSPQPQPYSPPTPQPQQYSPQPQPYSPPTPQPQQYSPQPQYSPQLQYKAQPASQNNSHPIPQMVASPEPHMKTSNVNIGSLYIPPIKSAEGPPSPPQRQSEAHSPQSPIPKLNTAPKPWQNQKKEQEIPQWAQRNQQPPSPPSHSNQPATITVRPPQMTTPTPAQMQQRPMPSPVQMQPPPPRPGVDVVWVTQPEVFQHPGPGPNNYWVPPQVQSQPAPPQQVQQPRQPAEPKGTRIIPIQIEGAPGGNDSQLNRQQSWAPNQSNSFKVLQKMTSMEGNEDYQETPMVEHGPRASQQFSQNQAEQMRKLNLNEGDKEFMNRVKQGVDEGTYLHNEVDPRYRGAAIPSKAFRLLQTMTDQPSSPGTQSPQVRTIPIKVEGNGTAQPYVHPSQQTVPEPKKYTGSAIPGKAFKMVQAMTSNALADGNQTSESNHPSSCQPWSYDNYPAPPYWEDYYSYYYPNSEIDSNNARKTPVPYWQYYPQPSPTPNPNPQSEQTDEESESEPKRCSSCRSTPVPYWGYPYPYYPGSGYDVPQNEKESSENESKPNSRQATPSFDNYQYQYPYWDPYYYSYYYGYPPMYPVPYYSEYDGYSSTDEMNYYVNQEKPIAEVDDSATPVPEVPKAEEISDNVSETTMVDDQDADAESESSGSESGDDIYKSATSMNTQSTEHEDLQERDEDVEYDDNETASENGDDDDDDDRQSVYMNEDAIPHVLSVIFEESERCESARSRESSVATSMSDETVVLDSDDIIDPEEEVVSVKLPLKLKFSISNGNKEITEVTVGNSEVNSFSWYAPEERTEYTIKSPIPNGIDVSVNLPLDSTKNLADAASRGLPQNTRKSKYDTSADSVQNPKKSKDSDPTPNTNDSTSESSNEKHVSDSMQDSTYPIHDIIEGDQTTTVILRTDSNEPENNEEEEIDFWSQIQTDEELVPKRNKFFNSYRNSNYSIDQNEEYESSSTNEEVGNSKITVIEGDNALAIEKNTSNKTSKVSIISDRDGNKGNEIINVTVNEVALTNFESAGNATVIGSDVCRNTEEQRITSIKSGDVESTIDVVNSTTEDRKNTVTITENEDAIEKVCVEEFKISNLVFEREELKQTLRAPMFDLGLDACFRNLKNSLKMSLPEFAFEDVNVSQKDISLPVFAQEDSCEGRMSNFEEKNAKIALLTTQDGIEDSAVKFGTTKNSYKLEGPMVAKVDDKKLADISEVSCNNNISARSNGYRETTDDKIIGNGDRCDLLEKKHAEKVKCKVATKPKVSKNEAKQNIETKSNIGPVSKLQDEVDVKQYSKHPANVQSYANQENKYVEVSKQEKVSKIKPKQKAKTKEVVPVSIQSQYDITTTSPKLDATQEKEVVGLPTTLSKLDAPQENEIANLTTTLSKLDALQEDKIAGLTIFNQKDMDELKISKPKPTEGNRKDVNESTRKENKINSKYLIEYRNPNETKALHIFENSNQLKAGQISGNYLECQNNSNQLKPAQISKDDLEHSECQKSKQLNAANISRIDLEHLQAEIQKPESVMSEESHPDDTDDQNSIRSDDFVQGRPKSRGKGRLSEDQLLDKEISDLNNNTQQDFYVPTIKERIRALQNASKNGKKKRVVKEIEVKSEECLEISKEIKSKGSTKSIDDTSEDDIDSGVTSDMSRHISDTESEFTELRKLNKYQRAATHSRLFKLLQGICDEGDETDMEGDHLEQYNHEMKTRRESLSLPLTTNLSDYDSIPSSSVNSPSSPVSDKLVNELVLSLLKKKKGKLLRNIPMKTLQAAAHKILQEEKCLNVQESPSDATTAHTPQEFYTDADYQQYYDSFETYDILPSKTFKSLEDKTETISGFAAKCPRVTSSKNLHKDLSDLMESTDRPTSTPVPDTSLRTQEAMSTS